MFLPTLLKGVLKLQDIEDWNLNDVPELSDTINTLICQLDLSWLDEAGFQTTEILRVIEIFVKSFVRTQKVKETDEQGNPEKPTKAPSQKY